MDKEREALEYLASINDKIQNLGDFDEVCVQSILLQGKILANLLNMQHYKTITEMRIIILDMFEQADQIIAEKSNTEQEQTEINPEGKPWFN